MNNMFKVITAAAVIMGLVACNGDATQETPAPTAESVPAVESSDEQLEGGTSWDPSDLPSVPDTTEDDTDTVVDATASV